MDVNDQNVSEEPTLTRTLPMPCEHNLTLDMTHTETKRAKAKIEISKRSSHQTSQELSADSDAGICRLASGSVDFTSIMFLSTGGAVVAANTTIEATTGSRKMGGKATWRDYKKYARWHFWMRIFPPILTIYLGSGLLVYVATIKYWACRYVLAITFVALVAIITLCITLWTGLVAFRLRKHVVVLNRGLVFVAQVFAGAFVGIPVFSTYALMDAGLFTPSYVERAVMDLCLGLCTFLYFSAVVARQRQIVYLFCNPNLSNTPKYTYRDTVICVGILYSLAGVLTVVFAVFLPDLNIHHVPMVVAHTICLLVWCVYAIQSRHASSQFSDFDQLRRLLIINFITVLVTHVWGIWQIEAFIVQSFMVLGLMVFFLLDSYISLFHFIRYELDPRFARDVVFTPQPHDVAAPRRFTTSVACSKAGPTTPTGSAKSDLNEDSMLTELTSHSLAIPEPRTLASTLTVEASLKPAISDDQLRVDV